MGSAIQPGKDMRGGRGKVERRLPNHLYRLNQGDRGRNRQVPLHQRQAEHTSTGTVGSRIPFGRRAVSVQRHHPRRGTDDHEIILGRACHSLRKARGENRLQRQDEYNRPRTDPLAHVACRHRRGTG